MIFKPDLTFIRLNLGQTCPSKTAHELLSHLKLQNDPEIQVVDTNLSVVTKLDWYLQLPQNQLALFCLPKKYITYGL